MRLATAGLCIRSLPLFHAMSSLSLPLPTADHWKTGIACLVLLCSGLEAQRSMAQQEAEPQLTQQQRAELFAERNRLWESAQALDQQGKLPEAVATAEKALMTEQQLYGEVHLEIASTLNWIAERQEQSENLPAAIRRRREALAIKEKLYGSGDWRVTDARLALQHAERLAKLTVEQRGRLREAYAATARFVELYGQGKYREAVPLAKETLELYKEVLGEKHPEYARSLNNLGFLLAAQGDYAQAEPLYRQALEVLKEVLGEKHPDYASSLNNLAELYRSQGDNAQAEPLHREALQVRKAVLGEKHPHYALSLNNLADLYDSQGDYAQAEPLYCQALEVRKEVLGENDPEYATSLNNLALRYHSHGDYAQAEPLFRQALEIFKKVQGEKHPEYTTSLNNLAGLLHSRGDYAQAKSLYRLALEIQQEVLGEKHPDYANSLNNLAGLLQSQGDYVQAEPLYRQALEVLKEVLGEQHPDYALSLNNLAELYRSQGDYAQAELLFRRALEIRKEVLGEKHPDYAKSLSGLAVLHHSQGDYAQAESLYRQALEIRKEELGVNNPDYATSLNNLAGLLQSQGDYAQAEPLYRQALEIRKEVLGEKHSDYAGSLNNLASLLESQGDYAQAEALYRQALEIRKQLLGEKHPDYANSLNNLAGLLDSQGDYAQAEPLYRQALASSLENLEVVANAQSERQQLAMTTELRYQLDNYLVMTAHAGRYETEAYRQWLAWKGIVFARQKMVRAAAEEPELKPLLEELQSVSSRLATLAFATPAPEQRKIWQQQVAEFSKKKQRLEAEMTRRSATYRAAKKQVTLEDLQTALPEGAALVDFVEVRKTQLLAFVVSSAGDVKLLHVAASEELNQAVDTWRESLGGSKQAREAGVRLRKMLWEPLEPLLEGKGLVLISPDGALGKFPLAALPGKEPGTYLLEERTLAVITAPQVLPELLSDKPAKQVAGNLLLLGDVDYDDRSGKLAANTPRKAFPGRRAPRNAEATFTPLDGSRGELASIEKMYRNLWGEEGIIALEGSAASEEKVRTEAPRHLYLHLATHGFFASERFRSALDRSVADKLPDDLLNRQSISGYNPGLLSGIALAGANKPDPDHQDGILTAEEVQSLDLRGVDLAVLSACETGLGKKAGGEGLLGLQRSFQLAGAKTVVASLWKVDDVATRDLMERFYRNMWEGEMGKLEALREAQLWMLRERGPRGLKPLEDEDASPKRLPPYYWAAFVLSGDWR
ncbi:MAG: tetratricopeptide repeat protein [Pirellulaceae bacterium]